MRPVPLVLDKPRALWFDLNALAELETALAQDIPDFSLASISELQLGNARILRALLWAGLLHEDPTLTILEVGHMVTPQHVGSCATAVSKALTVAFGVAEASEEANPPNGNGSAGPTVSMSDSVSLALSPAPSGG